MDRRKNILEETEQQIVDLVLLISRKVVKIISENQRNVIMSNVLHALRKVKGRGDVTIRVNLADMELTSEHVKDFIESVESVKNITIAEDSAVDRGGCIVETDFGSIDARISSQLAELEQKYLKFLRLKTFRALPSSSANKRPFADGNDFTKYMERVEQTETVHYIGSVIRVRGMLVESRGPQAVIGEICKIAIPSAGTHVLAEVVGLYDTTVQLMAYGDTKGIEIGCTVTASGSVLQVAVGRQLLGRVLDAVGKAYDKKARLPPRHFILQSRLPRSARPHPGQ